MAGRKMQPIKENEKNARPERRQKMQQFNQLNMGLKDISSKPPVHLSDVAKKEWKKIVKELKKAGIVKEIDQANLELFCTFYGVYVQAEENINTYGSVIDTDSGLKKNPAFAVMNDAAQRLKSLAIDLGLNYTARSAMIHDDPKKAEENATADVIKLFKPDKKMIE